MVVQVGKRTGRRMHGGVLLAVEQVREFVYDFLNLGLSIVHVCLVRKDNGKRKTARVLGAVNISFRSSFS